MHPSHTLQLFVGGLPQVLEGMADQLTFVLEDDITREDPRHSLDGGWLMTMQVPAWGQCVSRAVQQRNNGGDVNFVWLAARTMHHTPTHPHTHGGASYVW